MDRLQSLVGLVEIGGPWSNVSRRAAAAGTGSSGLAERFLWEAAMLGRAAFRCRGRREGADYTDRRSADRALPYLPGGAYQRRAPAHAARVRAPSEERACPSCASATRPWHPQAEIASRDRSPLGMRERAMQRRHTRHHRIPGVELSPWACRSFSDERPRSQGLLKAVAGAR